MGKPVDVGLLVVAIAEEHLGGSPAGRTGLWGHGLVLVLDPREPKVRHLHIPVLVHLSPPPSIQARTLHDTHTHTHNCTAWLRYQQVGGFEVAVNDDGVK